MGATEAIRDLLPSLWRPEPEASGLLSDLIVASGAGLDLARIDGGNIMQAHWSRFSDYAPISPFVAAYRRAAGAPVLLPSDPEVFSHPYIDDLARLAGLLGLVPYVDPVVSRESVEQFRQRVLGTIALWRGGVATRAAILQATRLALSGADERAVGIEEFSPGTALSHNITTRGKPDDMVGPLMRWQVQSHSLQPVSPEIYIQGVAPVSGKIDATTRPLVEHFSPESGTGTGLLYDGIVEPGQTLALLPSYSSWLGGGAGLRVATSLPAETAANPTAPGPWAASAGGPEGRVVAVVTAADGALWVAADDAGGSQLWRNASSGWTQIFAGLPRVRTLLSDGPEVLIGHANGLSRLAVFAEPFAAVPEPSSATGPSVNALAKAGDGTIWAATDTGAMRFDPSDPGAALQPVGPGLRAETETPLAAVLAEADGMVHLGGEAGIFRFDPSNGTWHIFSGESLDETVPDWRPWNPDTDPLPDDTEVFLPSVTALARGPDTILWIGTDAGLAGWGAHRIRNTYATRLRAFPAIGTQGIHALGVDERQRLWAGTERGLLVHDELDWFEESNGLTRLDRLDPEPVGSGWRFDRTAGNWQFADATGKAGFVAQTPDIIASDNGPVHAIHWSDGAIARLGSFADGVFTTDAGAVPAALRLRVKPTADRIVEGGLPALPRLDPGLSNWRYLTEEQADPPAPTAFPAWTREGRLLTPPDARPSPWEGRYLSKTERAALDQVFAFNPAARLSFRWHPRAPFSITVRLERPDPGETLPAALFDRIIDAADRVRPAGARVRLAFGETIVRGEQDG